MNETLGEKEVRLQRLLWEREAIAYGIRMIYAGELPSDHLENTEEYLTDHDQWIIKLQKELCNGS